MVHYADQKGCIVVFSCNGKQFAQCALGDPALVKFDEKNSEFFKSLQTHCPDTGIDSVEVWALPGSWRVRLQGESFPLPQSGEELRVRGFQQQHPISSLLT